MSSSKKRKEVLTDTDALKLLEFKAKKAGRNLKNDLEFVPLEESYAFEPSTSYKVMMDKMIEDHATGKTNYTSREAIKKGMN